MCGIIGYIGTRNCLPIILDGLSRLEYRGYDSAGVAYIEGDHLRICRSEGKLSNLTRMLHDRLDTASSIGMGHTRWATHGAPCERNAHPHSDCTGQITVVHNGIIENYGSLKQDLMRKGHIFVSDTDTEVLAHLVEEHLNGDLLHAVSAALKEVKGSFALAVMWSLAPEHIVAARRQSPLVVGVGEGETFVASDVPAFLPWTRSALFLNDGEVVKLSRSHVDLFSLRDGAPIRRPASEISWNAAMAEKSGFDHFMLKEIYEQPRAILDTCRGRLDPGTGEATLPEIALSTQEIRDLRKIVFVACGTSFHAGLVARYLMERWLKLPVEVELGSEFRYRDPQIAGSTLTVAISQSGETADTLASLRKARELGSKVISICNVLGSTVTRESDGTVYTHAGPEIGVASTKAFTTQVTALIMLTLYLGRIRQTIPEPFAAGIAGDLFAATEMLEREIRQCHARTAAIARELHGKSDFLYLGRNILYPIALEGALKLKEISYIHAEGYPAGEMKHGPIALIDKNLPIVALAPRDSVYDKMVSNIEEVKSRRGLVVAVGEAGDTALEALADFFVPLPKVSWEISPILYSVPLQLLAYDVAVLRGCDVDQPRNLAKSVTVE